MEVGSDCETMAMSDKWNDPRNLEWFESNRQRKIKVPAPVCDVSGDHLLGATEEVTIESVATRNGEVDKVAVQYLRQHDEAGSLRWVDA